MVIYEPFKTLPLNEFRHELEFEFPKLPHQLFDYYIVRVAREMARRGNLLRRRVVLKTDYCVTRYFLDSPESDYDLVGILNIRRIDDCSCCDFNEDIPRTFVPPAGALSCGRDIAHYDDQEKVLHIAPTHCCGAYFITMSVAPKDGACVLPAILFDDWLDVLVMGVKGKILMIAGRPWTNLRAGREYWNEFLHMVDAAAVETATHKQRGAVRMQFGKVM